MRLASGLEVLGHADVQLLRPAREPDPAAAGERVRLGELLEPEQLAVEAPRLGLAAGRRSHLHVVEAVDRHAPDRDIATLRDASATTSQQLPAPSRNTRFGRRSAT